MTENKQIPSPHPHTVSEDVVTIGKMWASMHEGKPVAEIVAAAVQAERDFHTTQSPQTNTSPLERAWMVRGIDYVRCYPNEEDAIAKAACTGNKVITLIEDRSSPENHVAADAVLQQNLRDSFEAMCAMRDAINEYVPMPSLESDLLQGPETSVFCTAIAEAVIAALQAGTSSPEKHMLGRFGHHPDPANDFCIEVEAIQGQLFDATHGISKTGMEPVTIEAVRERIERAMDFRVGGDEIAVAAKQTLRQLEAEANPAPQSKLGINAGLLAALKDMLPPQLAWREEGGFRGGCMARRGWISWRLPCRASLQRYQGSAGSSCCGRGRDPSPETREVGSQS